MKKEKKKPSDLLSPASVARVREARAAMSEEEWEEECRLRNESAAQMWIDMKRNFDAFINSPEGKAREALRVRLEEIVEDPVIRQSETCVEMLDAFIYCVSYRWGAVDSGAMIEPLAEHFNKVKAASGGKARVAADPKQPLKATVRTYWDRWQKQNNLYSSKAEFALDMLRMFGPESDEKAPLKSADVLTRWCRQWKKENATQPAK
ncbi:hypothetical protein [Polaromonas sp. AER18D-145]|uniref:hypothetical protein n=1 Tax=Polaromonas sp. AER18D-145 TaxID=1977060 RepID=UPI0011447CA0|nr:hypothetical protein [Polaromonas sp. AER18D-145]